MERVTVNIKTHELELVRQLAAKAGTSVSAYIAGLVRRQTLSEIYHAAAEAERDHPPTQEEIQRDAAHYIAADRWGSRREAVPGAA